MTMDGEESQDQPDESVKMNQILIRPNHAKKWITYTQQVHLTRTI
jgi:hypothetical protein